MNLHSHASKRAAFWLVLTATAAMGAVLLFWLPNHPVSGGLALGVLAILILKHIGLLLLVGSPLIAAVKAASVRLMRRRRAVTDEGPPAG